MLGTAEPSGQANGFKAGHSGQQLHVSGIFIVILEIALVVENLMPILVVLLWLPVHARGVGDRLIVAFSVTCILSGLASYFSGSWYGGAPTCTTYQVTSIWCNLSSLALLTYMCINCHFAVWHLRKIKPAGQQRKLHHRPLCTLTSSSASSSNHPFGHSNSLPSYSRPQCLHSDSNKEYCSESSAQYVHFNVSEQTTKMPVQSQLDAREDSDNFGSRSIPEISNEENDNKDTFHQISLKNASKVTYDRDSSRHKATDVVYSAVQNTAPREENIVNDVCDDYYSDDDTLQLTTHQIGNGINHIGVSSNDLNCKSNISEQSIKYDNSLSIRAGAQGKNYTNVNQHDESTVETQAGSNDLYSQLSSVNTPNKEYHQFANAEANVSTSSVVTSKGNICIPSCQSRDYVSLMLFFLYSCTLAISTLPVAGFGPQTAHTDTSCRSWIVPTPVLTKERTFFVVFLIFVCVCLVMGCSSGISVCLQVSKRMKRERTRRSRLYHEEENVPDIIELSAIDDMKRQYSLACIVMAGLLTWLPVALMLTLQKSGVPISEATLMYSNIATSLPGLLNPLLYSLAMSKYRAGYKAIIEKCCCKRKKQKPHHLQDVRGSSDSAGNDDNIDTTLDSTSEGHTCLHGRANPTYDPNIDITIDEEEDEEDDEDYFPDDIHLADAEAQMGAAPKISEKTPLQSAAISKPSAVVKTVVKNGSKPSWKVRPDIHSTDDEDKECLLVSRTVFIDEETGL